MLTKRRGLWAGALILYAVFWIWYTPWGGALTDEEVDNHFATAIEEARAAGRVSDADLTQIAEGDLGRLDGMKAFLKNDNGRSFVMVNLIDEIDGSVDLPGGGVAANSTDALMNYSAYMLPRLFSRASHPIFIGKGESSTFVLGDLSNVSDWDQVALVRYRSRRDFMQITGSLAFRDSFEFKAAAVPRSIAQPVTLQLWMFDLRFVLAIFMLLVTMAIDLFWLRPKTPS
ncbi:MAG: hypothetical protein AAFY19_08485 [Pseudomonadota bacterium]